MNELLLLFLDKKQKLVVGMMKFNFLMEDLDHLKIGLH